MKKSKRFLSFLLGSLVLTSASVSAADRPNILWITSEDNSIQWVGCYGGVNAKTPNIDALAAEGFRYTHCFDNAAVCAPTRSLWITGLYSVSMGTQPMRSRYAIPHDVIPYYPDQLKKAGYHIGNGGKTDYNIGSGSDKEVWKGGGDWRTRKKGQPFFTIKNIGDSHESNAFPKKGRVVHDPATMKLHPYHPDLPEMRETYCRYADGVERMDKKVGEILASLKKDGLYEDTIIVYCSDHGGALPRSKRFLYSSGIHCPLVVRIPEKWKHWWPAEKPGMTVDRIVSFIDMPKTWLSLAQAEIPETYQGTVFLGDGIEKAPEYHFSFRERADECADMVRSMRDERYTYIKNYYPWAPNGQHLKYMWTMTGTPAWEAHYVAGKCNAVQSRFFQPRVSEEFYDTVKDFHNIDNLIDDSKHAAKIAELKAAMRKKQLELFDSGLLPEAMRVRRAAENNLTIYHMIRDPKLYPLATYLDKADLALERNPKHAKGFVKDLGHADAGIRWWAVCGLFLLEGDAPRAALKGALKDDTHEVQLMAAWALHRQGETALAERCFKRVEKEGPKDVPLFESIQKWMNLPVPKAG